MSSQKPNRYVPLLLSLCIVIGILIGMFYTNQYSGNRLSIINTTSNKINDLLRIIDDHYVDTVNMTNLIEDAMPQILSDLDPHSVYIKAKDAEESMTDIKGSFSGIGVSFTIQEDTIHIINVIKGGPSEKVGLLAGDRIVTIDGEEFVGKEITSEESMKRLKGEKGTEVKLGIKRMGEKELLDFTIIRGDIPIHSVEASYMITPELGYIKVTKFSETTYPEMLVALARLGQEGFKGLIIDLRGNGGGIMQTAIQMANIFLPKGKLIVYTEGRNSPREEYISDGRGAFAHLPLVVLIDESSASASEIFAGAIQDNDRGTVIGRRSFGKGLVQQPIEFRDGSILRLTIARYYTPSGRCIQKPYENGHNEEYENDLMERYERGEFFSEDSIHQEGPQFKTLLGRSVYGGGGIMPDIFIPEDTSDITSYYKEAVISGLIHQYALKFTDSHRKILEEKESVNDMIIYLKQQNILADFAKFAQERGLRRRALMLYQSRKLFERNIFGNIINNAKDTERFYEYLNIDDRTVGRAIKILEEGKSYPTAPQNNQSKTHQDEQE
ncbi:MAG: S41 family peptidase [Paraprevotella sp.]|nr:S41 family peptidase [Paraprevotella sp.]